jgi:hypothetical protein
VELFTKQQELARTVGEAVEQHGSSLGLLSVKERRRQADGIHLRPVGRA